MYQMPIGKKQRDAAVEAVLAGLPFAAPLRKVPERHKSVLIIMGVWALQTLLFSLSALSTSPLPLAAAVLSYLAGPFLIGGCGAIAVHQLVTFQHFRHPTYMLGKIILIVIGVGCLAALAETYFAPRLVAYLYYGEDIATLAAQGVELHSTPAVTVSISNMSREFGLFLYNTGAYSTLYSLVGLLSWSLSSVALWRRQERALQNALLSQAQAQQAAVAARLEALRYQLNPHFLFNTLNSISSLIVTRRNEEGEAMLEQLAAFLRRTITADPRPTHTLDEELETVDAYLAIERVRFAERLAVEVEFEPRLRDAMVPQFLLQPLIENAVKYGVSSTDRQVTIRLAAKQEGEELVVTVEDDGEGAAGEAPPQGGTGIGLRNVRERLSALYGEAGSLTVLPRPAGYAVMLRLPLDLGDLA